MTHKYVVQSAHRINDILLLTLAPKYRDRRIDFTPGQYATIGFKRNGRPTPMRSFSIIGTQGSSSIQFAMRISGNFTQAATLLSRGDEVRVRGPFGEFTIDQEYDRHVVMLAAGIGITPFISMIRHAAETQSPTPMTLLFVNRSARHIPFYEELVSLEKQNPYLRVRFFCTARSTIDPSLFSSVIPGTIKEEYIRQLTGNKYAGSTYFICGPKKFIAHAQKSLEKSNVDESRILSESFAQSSSLTIGSRFSIR